MPTYSALPSSTGDALLQLTGPFPLPPAGNGWTASIGAAVFLLTAGAVLLYLFNRRLRQKIQAQTALILENQARLQESFQMSRDILYKTDLKTLTYVYVSPAAKTILGYAPDAVRDRKSTRLNSSHYS